MASHLPPKPRQRLEGRRVYAQFSKGRTRRVDSDSSLLQQLEMLLRSLPSLDGIAQRPLAQRSRVVAAWWLLALLVGACGEEKLPPPKTSGGPSSSETSDDSSSARSEVDSTSIGETTTERQGAECEVPTFEEDVPAQRFETLTATVVDQAGEPLPGLQVQACGLDVCLRGETNSSGRATITGDDDIAKLAFKYGDGLHSAMVALLLEGDGSYDLGEQRTVLFPPLDADNRFEPGATLTSSNATLVLAEDTETLIDLLSYADESEHVFVARAFEAEGFPESAMARGFESLWALGPGKTEFCPPATLSLPNSTALEPGSAVDLLLLVTDTAGRYGRYAEWTVIAQATVSKDGERIVTDADHGIPELGLVGVRPHE